jgi:Asp-tRNA(Asn)/Glu-tRNA(Gln) amidotransferase A subunit family amidase
VPAALYVQGQRFRAWYRTRVAEVFRDVFTRRHLGVFTQPLSFIGLPVPVTAPGALPIGVQLVAAPFREASLFRVAAHLEAAGIL